MRIFDAFSIFFFYKKTDIFILRYRHEEKNVILISLILAILLIIIFGFYFYFDSIMHIGVWHHELEVYDNNQKYLTKEKVSILEIPEMYNEITYDDYLNLLNSKEKCIVVIGNDSCFHCIDYKNITLTDIYTKYKIKIYHLDSNDNWYNLNLRGTPTTYLLEDGKVIESIFGYVKYDDLNNYIKQFKYWQ